MRMSRDHWPTEDEIKLATLFEEGKTDRKIASVLKRSLDAIAARRSKLGLVRKPKNAPLHPRGARPTASTVRASLLDAFLRKPTGAKLA